MYRILVFLALLLPGYLTRAQSSCYIFLADKGSSLTMKPAQFLSQKSLARRHRQCIAINETDYPVAAEYLAQLNQLGISTTRYSKWLNMVQANLTAEQFRAAASLPFVSRITRAAPMYGHRAATEVLPYDTTIYKRMAPYRVQLGMMGADVLHASGYRGKGVTITVMDDGFANVNTIPAFEELYGSGRILATRDFVFPGGDVYTTGKHGTLVLSQIAAYWPGRLLGSGYDASFILAHTENDTSESRQEEINWAMAAEWADSIGTDIISTSLGYSKGMTDSTENHIYAEMNGDSTIITVAADLAASKGMLVINSAGNEGNSPWHYISAPADGDSVLCVGAVDSSRTRTSFSSVGPTADKRLKPDIMCMGGRNYVIGTDGVRYQGSGTSFSCPLMSGLAACLWQSNPNATNMDVFKAITRSGDRYPYPDNEYGNGIADGNKAFYYLNGYYLPEPIDSVYLTRAGAGIFPNPARDQFRVVFNDWWGQSSAYVIITDLHGRTVFDALWLLSSQYNEFTIRTDSPGFGSGLYVVHVWLQDGSVLLNEKLMVDH